MAYTITTKDGITIRNIPDDIDPSDPSLKERVLQLRQEGSKAKSLTYSQVAPSEESVEAVLEKRANEPPISARDLVRSVAQGASMGFSDEVYSGIGAAFNALMRDGDFRADYERLVKEQRDNQQSFRENYPAEAMGLEILGSLAPTAVIMKPLRATERVVADAVPGLKTIAAKAPQTSKYAKTIGESALLGGIAGEGYSDKEFGEGFSEGARTGAIVGGILPPAAAAVRKGMTFGKDAVTSVGNSIGFGTGDTLARKRLLEAIQKDGTSAEELLAKAKAAQAGGYPVSLVDIAGPNVKNLAQRVIKRSGEDYTKLATHHEKRLEEIPQRTSAVLDSDLVKSRLGASDSYHDFSKSLDERIQYMDDYFANNFATRTGTMPDLVKDKLFTLAKNDPDFKEAFKRAREITGGRKDINLKDPEQANALLYYTKKGMDSWAASHRKPGYDPEVAKRIEEKSQILDSLLKEMSGDYSAQSGFMKDLLAQKEALALGARVYDPKMTPDALAESVKGMREDQVDAFLVGVREAAQRRLGQNKGVRSFSELILGTPSSDVRQKMSVIYSAPDDDMSQMLERLKTYDDMMLTSRTVPHLALNNPVSALVDPQARDIMTLGQSVGSLGGHIPGMMSAFKGYATSRFLPASSARATSRATYGPIGEAERLLEPMTGGPLSQIMGKVGQGAGALSRAVGPGSYSSGVLPQILEDRASEPY